MYKRQIYKTAIDALAESINEHVDINEIDYISGGERRDWFFSLVTAHLLKKPHITIFKDMDAYIFSEGTSKKAGTIEGARVLHIADLITGASSYEPVSYTHLALLAAGLRCHQPVKR